VPRGVEEMSLPAGGCHAWAFSVSHVLGLGSTGSSTVVNHLAHSLCLDMLLLCSTGIFCMVAHLLRMCSSAASPTPININCVYPAS
jgi:hypothetical protein